MLEYRRQLAEASLITFTESHCFLRPMAPVPTSKRGVPGSPARHGGPEEPRGSQLLHICALRHAFIGPSCGAAQ